MKLTASLVLAAYWAIGAVAIPTTAAKLGPLEIFHNLPSLPPKWTAHGPANGKTKVHARIGLKQSNIPALQEKLLDISNPDSPNYGKWLSKEELDAFTAPPAENVQSVKDWLSSHGITDINQPTSDWIEFTVPLSTMETLLDTKYQLFGHSTLKNPIPATTRYSIPKGLHDIIDLITPTTAFYTSMGPTVQGEVNKREVTEEYGSLDSRATCDTNAITPTCINSLYNVDYKSKGGVTAGSSLFIALAASHDDYSNFIQQYSPGAQDFQDVSIAGGSNAGSGDQNTLLEGNLDTQYIGGLSNPNPSQFLEPGPSGNTDQDFFDQMANFASYLNTADSPPSSVSTSYGGEENYFDGSYMDRVCNDFMKAGARGVSIFFSSGDYGVGGNGQEQCQNGYIPLWPAQCPWITSVGGTMFQNGQEVVAYYSSIQGAPGGGFSNHFPTPSYQQADVTAYEKFDGDRAKGYFNPNGRGYPDVSLVSINFRVIVNNKLLSVLGTSAAAPSWAALVSVLNDYRKSLGKPNLGFLNPLLYSAKGKSALRDVTSGHNQGCGLNGFPATTGWDPASGLGSLDFAKMRTVVAST